MFKSFEFTDLQMKHSATCLRIVIVCRSPTSKKSSGSGPGLFFSEFSRPLEELVTAPGSLLLVGDFNFHVDNVNDSAALQFLQLLDTFNLKQHVTGPTHKNGLDLLITRTFYIILRNSGSHCKLVPRLGILLGLFK